MVPFDAISLGENFPSEVNVIVEISFGREPVKYECDKQTGLLKVDRFLSTAMSYPGNYGFVPQTLAKDGDPCDILLISECGLAEGSLISCRPVGVLLMEDEAGKDEKIIAVPSRKLTRYYDNVASYQDIPPSLREKIEHFFQHYKDLEKGKWTKIIRWGDLDEAYATLQEAADYFRQ